MLRDEDEMLQLLAAPVQTWLDCKLIYIFMIVAVAVVEWSLASLRATLYGLASCIPALIEVDNLPFYKNC